MLLLCRIKNLNSSCQGVLLTVIRTLTLLSSHKVQRNLGADLMVQVKSNKEYSYFVTFFALKLQCAKTWILVFSLISPPKKISCEAPGSRGNRLRQPRNLTQRESSSSNYCDTMRTNMYISYRRHGNKVNTVGEWSLEQRDKRYLERWDQIVIIASFSPHLLGT